MAMHSYTARWMNSDNLRCRASVTFGARSDAAAVKKANKIAAEVDSTNSPRSITENITGRQVHYSNTGVSL